MVKKNVLHCVFFFFLIFVLDTTGAITDVVTDAVIVDFTQPCKRPLGVTIKAVKVNLTPPSKRPPAVILNPNRPSDRPPEKRQKPKDQRWKICSVTFS